MSQIGVTGLPIWDRGDGRKEGGKWKWSTRAENLQGAEKPLGKEEESVPSCDKGLQKLNLEEGEGKLGEGDQRAISVKIRQGACPSKLEAKGIGCGMGGLQQGREADAPPAHRGKPYYWEHGENIAESRGNLYLKF